MQGPKWSVGAVVVLHGDSEQTHPLTVIACVPEWVEVGWLDESGEYQQVRIHPNAVRELEATKAIGLPEEGA